MKNNKKVNYEDALSDFLFDVSSKLGGGLPTDYFTRKELIKIEKFFKKKHDAEIKLNSLIN